MGEEPDGGWPVESVGSAERDDAVETGGNAAVGSPRNIITGGNFGGTVIQGGDFQGLVLSATAVSYKETAALGPFLDAVASVLGSKEREPLSWRTRRRLRQLLRQEIGKTLPQGATAHRLTLKTGGGTGVTVREDDPAEALMLLRNINFPALEQLAEHPAQARWLTDRWIATVVHGSHPADHVWDPRAGEWQRL